LVLLPHPASDNAPEVYAYPQEIEVVGQVAGVAMRIQDGGKRRRGKT
jgi:hypothetical protein